MTVCEFGYLYLTKKEYKEMSYQKNKSKSFKDDKSILKLIRELPLYALPEDELIEISKHLKDMNSFDENKETILSYLLKHTWWGTTKTIKKILEN